MEDNKKNVGSRQSRNEFVIAGTIVRKYCSKNFTVITVITRNSTPNFPQIYCYRDCKRFVDGLAPHSNVTIKGRVSTFRAKDGSDVPHQVLTAESVKLSKPTMSTAFGDGYQGKAYLYPNTNALFIAGEIVYVSGTDRIKKYLVKVEGVKHPAFIQITQYVQKRAPRFAVGDFINAYCDIQTVRKERDDTFVDFVNFVMLEAHRVKENGEEEENDD